MTLGIAVLGFWHVHADEYANSARDNPGTHLAAIWDRDAERGRAAAHERGVPFVGDLDEVLTRPDVDGVIITNETTEHTAVILAAIAAGKHVFSEKLLAPTTADVQLVIDAATAADVRLHVSLPYLAQSPVLTALALIADGRLGRVHYARVRVAHDGALAGWLPDRFFDAGAALGGALTDLGCHPVVLMLAFMGREPATVFATYGSVTGRGVEDLASTTASFSGGGVGLAETSFVDPGHFEFEVTGASGGIAFSSRDAVMRARGPAFSAEEWSEVAQVRARSRRRSIVGSPGSRPPGRMRRTSGPRTMLTRYVVASNLSAASGEAVRF